MNYIIKDDRIYDIISYNDFKTILSMTIRLK
jgi:hypothetical protein